jgi:hypothetical protein
MSPNAGGGVRGPSCAQRAQVNFGDLTPYLTYALMTQCLKGILGLLFHSKGSKHPFFKQEVNILMIIAKRTSVYLFRGLLV